MSGLAASEYARKGRDYFGSPRVDYVDALPMNPQARILEIGCGDGATGGLALKAGRCGAYVGVELFAPMAEQAKEVLSAVHVGDVERLTLPYGPGHFDALILSEVLEHLANPEATLRRLAPLVRAGGLVFASSPNVSHWRIILGLIGGRFDYTDQGVMDRTHLRWFTPRSYRRMFEEAGFSVSSMHNLSAHRWRTRLLDLPGGHLFWGQIDLRGIKAK